MILWGGMLSAHTARAVDNNDGVMGDQYSLGKLHPSALPVKCGCRFVSPSTYGVTVYSLLSASSHHHPHMYTLFTSMY